MSAALPPMIIRDIETIDEYHACEDLQRAAWGFHTDLDIIPLTQLVATRKSGGVLLGAFDADDRLLGFTYGFLGRDGDGAWLLYSHMTAVQPDLRASGLGRALKWAQCDAALERGLELMVWTYDPLESLNGYFNFSKLGVVAANYWPNLYGTTSSKLHAGTPTDRLRADWYLSSERARRRRQGVPGQLAGEVAADPERFACVLQVGRDGAPAAAKPVASAAHLLCEIPADVQILKRSRAELAVAWRQATRQAFVHYLGAGYFVRECVRTHEPAPRTFYVMERGTSGPLED